MKQTVYANDFINTFRAIRPDNFTYEGLVVLYDYLTEYEDSCDTELELDVIALCCDFSEEHYSDLAKFYEIDLSGCETDKAQIQVVIDFLNEAGCYCGITDDNNIIYRMY